MNLAGKVALVMGGSQSLGRAIAIELAEQGASTAICSRPKPEAPEIVAELKGRGLEVVWEPGDMKDPESMVATVNRVVERYGRLDIMVVSGAPTDGARADLFEVMDPVQYHRMLDSQFVSRLNCLHAAVKPMVAQGYGKVVFITSDAGRTPTPSESMVGAAAAALMFFTRAAGKELARKGIRINCISTTLTTDTPSYNLGKMMGSDHVLSKAFAKIEALAPFRLNVPSDIAKTALFLSSPDSDQVSGAVISVNGGISFP
ncbi:MAG: SDR family oxidoreductase [Georgfuchsia sp.]